MDECERCLKTGRRSHYKCMGPCRRWISNCCLAPRDPVVTINLCLDCGSSLV